jgi:hypothetical protein
VPDDVLVVSQQQIVWQFLPFEQPQPERVVEVGNVVLIHTLQVRSLKVIGEILKARDTKQAQHPLIQH